MCPTVIRCLVTSLLVVWSPQLWALIWNTSSGKCWIYRALATVIQEMFYQGVMVLLSSPSLETQSNSSAADGLLSCRWRQRSSLGCHLLASSVGKWTWCNIAKTHPSSESDKKDKCLPLAREFKAQSPLKIAEFCAVLVVHICLRKHSFHHSWWHEFRLVSKWLGWVKSSHYLLMAFLPLLDDEGYLAVWKS